MPFNTRSRTNLLRRIRSIFQISARILPAIFLLVDMRFRFSNPHCRKLGCICGFCFIQTIVVSKVQNVIFLELIIPIILVAT